MANLYINSVLSCDQRRRDKFHLAGTYARQHEINIVDSISEADFAVIFTCAFSLDAQSSSLDLFKKIRSVLPDNRIIILGCLPKSAPHLIKESNVYSIAPNEYKSLDTLFLQLGIISEIKQPFDDIKYNGVANNDGDIPSEQTWLISLGEGCLLEKCSYCVKSKSCGKIESVPISEVLISFKKGMENGHQRFRFIGEDIAAYGKDIDTDFPRLIEYILDESDLSENPVHFNTLMNGMNPEFLWRYKERFYNILKRKDLVFDGIQLSVQSFNQKLIKNCHRPGNPKKWESLIRNIKRISPFTEIWVQLIIGLPGQTEKILDENLKIIDNLPIDVIHFYGYSHLEGSVFWNTTDFVQSNSDKFFEILLEKVDNYDWFKESYVGRSLIVSRFNELSRNENNIYYHRYRGMKSI